jgi:hypothetical protein
MSFLDNVVKDIRAVSSQLAPFTPHSTPPPVLQGSNQAWAQQANPQHSMPLNVAPRMEHMQGPGLFQPAPQAQAPLGNGPSMFSYDNGPDLYNPRQLPMDQLRQMGSIEFQALGYSPNFEMGPYPQMQHMDQWR